MDAHFKCTCQLSYAKEPLPPALSTLTAIPVAFFATPYVLDITIPVGRVPCETTLFIIETMHAL